MAVRTAARFIGLVLVLAAWPGWSGCQTRTQPTEWPAGEAVWVLPSAGRAPGTRFGEGFTVVDGSALVGTTFRRDDPAGEPLQVAVLAVTGDPAAVWRGYLDQVHALGTLTQSWCVLLRPDGSPVEDPPARTDEDVEWSCHAYPAGEGAWFNMHLAHGRAVFSDGPDSHLVLQWAPASRRPGPSEDDLPDRATTVLVDHRARGAEPGERVDTGPGGIQLSIEPGSRLAVSPFEGSSSTGGLTTVIEVTGDRDQVWDAYVHQLNRSIGVEPFDAGPTTMAWSQAGGWTVRLTRGPDEGGAGWLLLTAFND